MAKPWENSSGLPDPTAYAATKPITDEERRVSELANTLRQMAKLAGYEITNRMEFQDKKTGRRYR